MNVVEALKNAGERMKERRDTMAHMLDLSKKTKEAVLARAEAARPSHWQQKRRRWIGLRARLTNTHIVTAVW